MPNDYLNRFAWGKPKGKMHVHTTTDLIDWIDKLAHRCNCSRSSLVGFALTALKDAYEHGEIDFVSPLEETNWMHQAYDNGHQYDRAHREADKAATRLRKLMRSTRKQLKN